MFIEPEHPGKELWKLLQEHNYNISQFAKSLGVSVSRVSEILSGKRRITVDSACKIADAFDMQPEHWITMQNQYDIFQRNLRCNE